jgi:hypothetical protein
MSSVVISGDTSGAITVSAPAVAGTNTLTLQAATATSAVNTLGTAVASTSGTSIDFTGLPSWIKRITVAFSALSTSGTSTLIIQLGTGSTTYTTTGYNGGVVSSTSLTTNTTGMLINGTVAAADSTYGVFTLVNLTGNTWSSSCNLITNAVRGSYSSGQIALAAALTAVRITTTNGTDTFDAGTVNILYEG